MLLETCTARLWEVLGGLLHTQVMQLGASSLRMALQHAVMSVAACMKCEHVGLTLGILCADATGTGL